MAGINDLPLVYPAYNGSPTLGASSYKGEWKIYFKIPSDTPKIEILDGDFDRASDTDDPNTVGKPVWAPALVVNEGKKVTTERKDDNLNSMYKISPAVYYELMNTAEQPIYINNNALGANEWELFSVSTNSADKPDFVASGPFAAGMYSIRVAGLDLQNNFWLSVNYPICDIPENGGCPPMPNE